jgi:CBS domain containing-hemolysin-like protein
MVPRVSIKALPITAKIDELLFEFVENQISTVLVYQGTIDNIIGVVYIKDVINWFRMHKPFNLSMFVRDVIFVPPTMRTLDLLLQMRETGIKISVVVDEYGGVDGCISFSDLVEEIIGDIQDADEQRNKKKIIKNVDGSFTTDARTILSEISKNTGIKFALQDKSVDSIGGYIVSIVGKVPVRGELVLCEKSNVEFEILDADPRKIKSIKIRKIA